MTIFRVDTERSALDVRVEPSLLGFRMHISGLRGEIEGTIGRNGTVELDASVGAEVTMDLADLVVGSPLLTRTTRRALDLAGDGSVTGRLLDVVDEPGGRFRFAFEVESGRLQGQLEGSCQIETRPDGSALAMGTTDFRAADFDVHLPGLDHLRGRCHWTVALVPV